MKRGEGQYYNPDPLYHLIGRLNETKMLVDDHEVMGLIDSGTNISAISNSFAEKLGLPFKEQQTLLNIIGSVPYSTILRVY